MLRISEEQVKEILSMGKVIPTIKDAYRANVEGTFYAGDRIFMPVRDEENVGQWLVANTETQPYFGSKFSAVFPKNPKHGLPSVISTISLYSRENGTLKALIDADYLTAIKTGANAAVATDLLARKDAKVLGIIGTGLQAFSQVLAIQEVREIDKLIVSDVDETRVQNFITMIEKIKNHNYDIIAASSNDDLVSQSDIICTCTPSHTPVFDGNKLKPGTHVNAIGSFTSFMQEIDSITVKRSSKIITEHLEGLWGAAGDILIPLGNGEITKDVVTGTIGEALVGKIPTREHDEEITLHESVGSGVLDIALSILVFEELQKKC